MNRKGFAITTVVYGLALLGMMVVTMLMGILSSTRNNVSQESDRIESNLINYNKSSVTYKIKTDDAGNSIPQKFTTPTGEAGWYRIEAYGASGKLREEAPKKPEYTGTADEQQHQREEYENKLAAYNNAESGFGAYTTGIIYLNEDDELEIIPGKLGGSGQTSNTVVKIRTNPSTSTYELIMSAAGGTPSGIPGGTLKTQSGEAKGPNTSRELCTITDANRDIMNASTIKYGDSSVVGNTSIIVGYPGCGKNKVVAGSNEYYFVDGLMLPSVHNGNGKVIVERIKEDTELYENNVYNSSKIETEVETYLDPPIKRIPRTNEKFNDVVKIIVTLTPETAYPDLKIEKIIYTVEGIETSTNCNNLDCTATLGAKSNVDDITITFNKTNINLGGVRVRLLKEGDPESYEVIDIESASVEDQEKYKKTLVYDSTIRKTGDSYDSGIYSTPTGIKLSAYQPDTVSDLPSHGNYYIIPVTLENKVISAVSTTQDDSSIIGVEYLTGEPRQRWSIDLLNIPNSATGEPNFINIKNQSGMREYRMIDLARSKSLTLYRDENRNGGTVSASQNFNAVSRNPPHIWNIKPMADGTFAIKTAIQSLNPSTRSGYLYANTTKGSDNENMILVGAAATGEGKCTANDNCMSPTLVERFRLYSVDFSTTSS